MATDRSDVERGDSEDKPGLRQKLHAATGDREAEAEALADAADTDVEDAEVAVKQAHGDIQGVASTEQAIANPEDARAVQDEESD